MKDFYYLLGTDVNSTEKEIREAYRKLSKKFHPDVNQEDTYFESHFREIQEAYETLIDPYKRGKYDAAFRNSSSIPLNEQFYTQTVQTPKNRSKTGIIDIGFTIILIGLTLIFGDYVMKSIANSKAAKANSIAATSAIVPPTILKHHKKKHILKAKAAFMQSQIKVDSIKPHLTQPLPALVPAYPIKTVPVAAKDTKPIPEYLYATTIRSNVTGVTNMKKLANLSSEVVKEIPTGSEVFVVERDAKYYKVLFDGVAGFVPKWTVVEK